MLDVRSPGSHRQYLDEVYGHAHAWLGGTARGDTSDGHCLHSWSNPARLAQLVTGLSPRRGRLLNIAARRALVGDADSRYADHPPSRPSCQRAVQVTSDAHLYCAIAIFGDKVTALQLVWSRPGVVTGGRRTSTKVAVPSRCSGLSHRSQPDASAQTCCRTTI